MRFKNLAWISVDARESTYLAPASLSSDVVSSEDWKFSPMHTAHRSKLSMPMASSTAGLVASPICALVT